MTSRVYDRNGGIRYSIVTDSKGNKAILAKSGKLLGRITNGKTYDSSGRLVSYGEDVSALVE